VALDPLAIRLDDTVAVVTGAAQGIGAATAVALARFGADVAICDRNAAGLKETEAAIRDTGRRAFALELDVRDGAAVAGFLADARNELGPLGVLVNNAGGGFWAPFLDVRPRGQAALIEENFGSVTHVVRHGVPLMTDGGSIINVTSVEAFRAAPGFAVYAAMKAAVEQLSRSLALELSERRIRVNCVAPDAIPTPGDAELAFPHLDADPNQPSDHVLLGPPTKPPLNPQALVLHNPHPQDKELWAILLTSSDGLKAMAPNGH